MLSRRIFIIALLLCFALASPCLAKKSKPQSNDPVKALVEQHNKALSAQDLKGIMDTYASTGSVVLMGTGPGETYVGEESIGGAYDQFFNKFKADTLNFKYDWISTGSRGNIAWFAVTVIAEGIVDNEKKERAFNMSGTMEKVKGKWRLVNMHFSRLGVEHQSTQQPK